MLTGRFWGYVQGTGTPEGSVTEFLMAILNSNVGGREHIAPYVEKEVCEEFSFFPRDRVSEGIVIYF
jgi:hypothetical protein